MTVQQHATTQTVLVYEDDPGAPLQENVPVRHPVPQLDTQPFPTAIAEAAPHPDSAGPGTPAFRYWVAAHALSTGCQTWGPLVPTGTQWVPSVGRVLTVHLDEGVDLNAFYDRRGLKFFHQRVEGVDVFSGQSPEIVRHELGHAVLDALRPQLFNAAMHESDALHEAFGDISALLTALQLESLRITVLTQTQGSLEQSSRVSRLAEQLGWAVRKVQPDAAEPDCLRNMSNHFFYRDPVHLPPLGPGNMLTSETHSFSRVFSGAFLKIVAGIFRQQDSQDQAALAEAARIMRPAAGGRRRGRAGGVRLLRAGRGPHDRCGPASQRRQVRSVPALGVHPPRNSLLGRCHVPHRNGVDTPRRRRGRGDAGRS